MTLSMYSICIRLLDMGSKNADMGSGVNIFFLFTFFHTFSFSVGM